jgi:hypothetical protein
MRPYSQDVFEAIQTDNKKVRQSLSHQMFTSNDTPESNHRIFQSGEPQPHPPIINTGDIQGPCTTL